MAAVIVDIQNPFSIHSFHPILFEFLGNHLVQDHYINNDDNLGYFRQIYSSPKQNKNTNEEDKAHNKYTQKKK